MAEKFQPSAKVVDGLLILSLPDAISPVVWQMEVGQSKSSALEVRPAENDNAYSLILKTARADVLDIARYETKEHAVRALLTVSQAMEKASGHIRAADGYAYGSARSQAYNYSVPVVQSAGVHGSFKNTVLKPFGYMVSAVVLLAVLFVISNAMLTLFTGPSSRSVDNGYSSISPSSEPAAGEPMSAEDFFERR